MAVFTSGLLATVLAMARAAARSAQPVISMVTRCVAPFAVAGNGLGQVDRTLRRALGGRRPDRRPASGSPPAAPLATSSTVSLVLMWPSTLMQLKLTSADARSAAWAVAGSSGASVMIKASMVAMLGPIIAAPLAMPVI